MVALCNAACDRGIDHLGWCPPWQPPTTNWLAIHVTWNVRLAAHPLLNLPRIALRRLVVLGLVNVSNPFTNPMRLRLKQILRVGADRCGRPRVTVLSLCAGYEYRVQPVALHPPRERPHLPPDGFATTFETYNRCLTAQDDRISAFGVPRWSSRAKLRRRHPPSLCLSWRTS